jgi:uridine kinase
MFCGIPGPMSATIVGIAGGSGSGKTTIARKIAEALPGDGVGIIEHDAYYRDRQDLSFEERCQVNFDHPESLETELLVEQIIALKAGKRVAVPVYDFKTHRRTDEPRWLEPRPVVIVEGILALVDARLRAELDIKIFVDTDPDIRIFRRIRRDIEQRGRTFESVSIIATFDRCTCSSSSPRSAARTSSSPRVVTTGSRSTS